MNAKPAFVRPEAVAIRALASGSANEQQQRLALAAIRQKVCLEDQLSYVAGDPGQTQFNEGRRFVGISIRAVLTGPIEEYPEVKHG